MPKSQTKQNPIDNIWKLFEYQSAASGKVKVKKWQKSRESR